jgi:hypothetical protein
MTDFHVYEVRAGRRDVSGYKHGDQPYPVASCDGDSLAFTLRTLVAERQLTADSRIGILYRPDADGPGVWIVNPWAKGREER